MYIKRCEIPFTNTNYDDSINIKFKIVDLGNQNISIKTEVNGNFQDPLKIKYNGNIIPIFDDF